MISDILFAHRYFYFYILAQLLLLSGVKEWATKNFCSSYIGNAFYISQYLILKLEKDGTSWEKAEQILT